MITITGLTGRQKGIMDLLWNCRDLAQIQLFIKSLPTKADQYDALSLVTIATQESIEQELGFSQECRDAASLAISRAQQ
jgi:hypothetical protein